MTTRYPPVALRTSIGIALYGLRVGSINRSDSSLSMYLRNVSSSSAERRLLGRAGGGYLSGMPGVLMTCLYP